MSDVPVGPVLNRRWGKPNPTFRTGTIDLVRGFRRHSGHDPARSRHGPRAVLALMAEGRSNAAIAAALTVSDRAVEKHVAGIFTKLNLPPAASDHRRVLAVLRYLEGGR